MNISPFTQNDIYQINHLQPEGWSDIMVEFNNYLAFDFCKPIKVEHNNNIIGIGNSILFEKSGWISHIIVDSAFQGQGICYSIVECLMEKLTLLGARSISLIATEIGEPLYKKAGFRWVSDYSYLSRVDKWIFRKMHENIMPLTFSHHVAIFRLDRYISGENRENLIRNYLENGLVYHNKGVVEGYYLTNLGQGAIYATSINAGIELLSLKYALNDKAVLPSENENAIQFLKENGFEESKIRGKRMIYGEELAWLANGVFSRIGGNYG